MFFISIAIVIGPTPPGTGVIALATSETSLYATSPQSFPFSSRFIPTSITIAPSLTISAVMNFALPTAATRMSARRQTSLRFFVLLWQIVTVPFSWRRSIACGLPTILLLPTTTHSLPHTSIFVRRISSITPAGVQGRKSKLPIIILPTFTGWNASTSFSGRIERSTFSLSIPLGRGSCTRIPLISFLLLRVSISSRSSSSVVSLGRAYSSE